jgi:hypothetical protein
MAVKTRMATTAAEAMGERLAGGRPSRTKSFFIASAAGMATGVLVYKTLRSGDDGGGGEDADDSGD